ncbi:PAS domain S-box-containing protein/diguanylate cyclase (GGDEF)-like protein [Rhodobacter sp. JA431]|uniref:EAL domain-containing protein n=1 Tax=Rhodobacter sp. JA431 TaxID=570013 RepID=UPI000BD95246|nr:EAL domain-containing protein [Rhodobacter sp. JA431]SOB89791.1 PAS domain S-box-containing protein/diguanylate cyclase (GGDEF)-like protein [Rhodobacter sp. JA431]
MSERPPAQGSTARPVRTTAEEGRFGRQGASIDTQFEQVETLVAHAGMADGVGRMLARLRVHVAEQSMAMLDLLEHDLRQRAEMQELRDLLELMPVPVLCIGPGLDLHFANRAGQAFFGARWRDDGAAALRHALTRQQAARLVARLPADEGTQLSADDPLGALVLHVASDKDQTVAVQLSALRCRKSHPAAEPRWWLVLDPAGEGIGPEVDLYRHLLDASPDPLCVADTEGRMLEVNSAYLAHLGRNAVDVIGHMRREFMPLIDALKHDQLDARVRATQSPFSFEETRSSGSLFEAGSRVRVEKRPLFDAAGQVMGIVTQSRDVTEERRVSELADMVFEYASDAIALTNPDLRILRVNTAFEQLAGFGFAQIDGRPLVDLLFDTGGARLRGDTGLAMQLRDTLANGTDWSGEIALRSSEGRIVPCLGRVSRLADASGTVLGYVAFLSDMSQLRQAKADNRRLANFDLLTGLPNRPFLSERIDGGIASAEQRGRGLAVLFLDLDGFKAVNDSLGHDIGDLLLKAVARRLQIAVDGQQFVARIGGDEFVILLEGALADQPEAFARALLADLARPLDLPGLHEYHPAGSIGIASYPAHGDSRETLLRNADLAMYEAKRAHGSVVLYEHEMGVKALRELELRTALSRAVERGELVLHYQPLFRLADRSLYGAEALLRWNRPGVGLEKPGDFMPVAERAGLMPMLDRWVLREAVAQLSKWRDAGALHEGFKLSINQTAADLAEPGWAEALTDALVHAHQCAPGAPPLGLQIELTEEQLAHGMPGAVETLMRLRTMGVRLAIDDFGTGYSSLAYLTRLPVSMLKIASEFVRDIEKDPNAQLIVETITGLAQQFGCATLAEGIETEDEARLLDSMGCELGQGFVVSPALPLAEFERLFLRPQAPKT